MSENQQPHATIESDTTTQPNLIKNIPSPSVKAPNKSTGKRTSSIIEKRGICQYFKQTFTMTGNNYYLALSSHTYCTRIIINIVQTKLCTENPNRTAMNRTFLQENFSQSKTNSCQVNSAAFRDFSYNRSNKNCISKIKLDM